MEATELSGRERRGYPRFRLHLSAMLANGGGSRWCRVLDFSRSGMLLTLHRHGQRGEGGEDRPPAVGEAVELTFYSRASGGEQVLKLPARVARLAGEQIGITFTEPDSNAITALERMIGHEVAAEVAGPSRSLRRRRKGGVPGWLTGARVGVLVSMAAVGVLGYLLGFYGRSPAPAGPPTETGTSAPSAQPLQLEPPAPAMGEPAVSATGPAPHDAPMNEPHVAARLPDAGGAAARMAEGAGDAATEVSGAGGDATIEASAGAGDAATEEVVAAETPPGWVVQLYAFRSAERAARERERLRDLGVDARQQSVMADGRALYRLRVGGFASFEEAERYAAELRETIGLEGWVVRD